MPSDDSSLPLSPGGGRCDRLARLAIRLDAEGSTALRAKADRLGIPVGALKNYLAGFPIPEDVARDIEWTLALPDGWLDGKYDEPEIKAQAIPVPVTAIRLASSHS